MGVRIASVSTAVLVTVLPASNAEVIVCTTPPLILPQDAALVFLFWYFLATVGTGTTSWTMQIRRGTTLTAPLVTTAAALTTPTVGNNQLASGCYIDSPGAGTALQYSLTCTQAGATAAGTNRDQQFIALVL